MSPPTTNLRVEQQRIGCAYGVLSKVSDPKVLAAWRTSVLGFGADVQRCGLLQTVAFLHRGKDEESKNVAKLLSGAVRGHLWARRLIDGAKEGELLADLREMDGDRYMLATREVLALSVWLKRATQAHEVAESNPAKS